MNQPRNLNQPAITMNQPRNLNQPAITMNQPRNLNQPAITMNQPRNLNQPAITMNQPRNLNQAAITLNQPRNLNQPPTHLTNQQKSTNQSLNDATTPLIHTTSTFNESSSPEKHHLSSDSVNKCLKELFEESLGLKMCQSETGDAESGENQTQSEETQETETKTDGPQGEAETVVASEDETGRETWGNQFQFFFYCLGYAVGFGNVWRFPYLCYKNGGAAFLIPYFTILALAGIPIFCIELVMGQYISLGPVTLFPKLAPILSGLGYGVVVISLFTAVYFNVILAWTFFYTFATFSSVLPWSVCDNDFNSPMCYTKELGDYCRNLSLHYYNFQCMDSASYCQVANYDAYNDTFCYDPQNPTKLRPVEGAVGRRTPGEDYFRNRVLGVTGRTWSDMGGLRWELVGCLILGWAIVAACLARGIKTTGKIVYITAIFPYAILIILLIRGLTLDGAYQGLEFYLLKPNLTRLGEMEVWSDAAIQIFFSCGICFGALITLSSYNKFNNNCIRDAFVLSLSNCCTSILIGLVIFSVLGFLAKELDVEVQDVVTSGSGLAFVVFPSALSLMPLPQLWSILFFVMLMNIGFGSQFTMVETVITAVMDRFEVLKDRKAHVVVTICVLLCLMGVMMVLEGGIYMFELFFFFSAALSVILLGLTQLIGIQSIFGFQRTMSAIEEMGIKQPRILKWYWNITWRFITPMLLLIIVFFSIYYYVPAYWGDYIFPFPIQLLGWMLCLSAIICVPIGAIHAAVTNKGSFKDLFKLSPEFCPASERQKLKLKSAEEYVPKFRYLAYQNNQFVETEMPAKDTQIPAEK